MASAYTNFQFDVVMAGMESILETEFTSSANVLLRLEPLAENARQQIRIWPINTEFVSQSTAGATKRFFNEVVIGVQRTTSKRGTDRKRRAVASRAEQVLEDNTKYAPADVYKWHDGHGSDFEETEEGIRFIYSMLVSEC